MWMQEIKTLFTQNSNLRKSNIFAWTLPALGAKLTNTKSFMTCPQAGECAKFCYARNGSYMFAPTRKAHLAKLEAVLYHRSEWIEAVNKELSKNKYQGKFIRWHDSGDFFEISYLLDTYDIARKHPNITFYAYTKEVKLIKDTIDLQPANFTHIFSYGGKQDHLIDPLEDRNCNVFGSMSDLINSGYALMQDNDSFAATSTNHNIGIYRNNIKHFVTKMGDKSFASLQADKL
jgi:hypothetical protein